MSRLTDDEFIAMLQQRAVTHGGASAENEQHCDTVARMILWHGAFMRGDVPFSWCHCGPMSDVTPRHLALLQEMAQCGFISIEGTPEANERPSRASVEMTEYLVGYIDRSVLARLDLTAPLMALVGDGRRLVVHGEKCELPPALNLRFGIRPITGERESNRIFIARVRNQYADAPSGVRGVLPVTHEYLELHMLGDAPVPFYDLVLARLRTAVQK